MAAAKSDFAIGRDDARRGGAAATVSALQSLELVPASYLRTVFSVGGNQTEPRRKYVSVRTRFMKTRKL